jgi:Ser/Thr protein kinase RdoA (MazF antagonist)
MCMTTPIFQTSHLAVPRPDRLYRRFAFQRRPSAVAADLLRHIVGEYGLELRAAGEIPGGPGRSDNLICVTSAGKKMLKRYKQTVEPDAIRHEHSILTYLARVDFPAPRLASTADGETLVSRNGGHYALFDVLEGYFQYHDYFHLPAQTQRFIAASGAALGSLHETLRHFTPEGRNPNGFVARRGERWRSLEWYIARLDHCGLEAPDLHAEDAPKLRRMLSQHAGSVEETLRLLDGRLRAAAPPCLIVHGDYGPYNLFFKRGAPVVILDFELARLDWRLTDLATALPSFARSRLGFSFRKMNCFLAGYRARCPIELDELMLLPDVWRFLTLRRLIVCWRRFCETRVSRWLDEAQQRLDLARWLIEHQQDLAGWLRRQYRNG